MGDMRRDYTKFRRVFSLLFIGFVLLGMMFYFIKLPENMAGWLVPFKVAAPSYIPIHEESKYSKIVGFDRVQIIYENQDESITVWATSQIGWNNVSSWDEKVNLSDGTTAHYTIWDNTQMISWKRDKVEYAIDYKGKEYFPKEELIKIASSIE